MSSSEKILMNKIKKREKLKIEKHKLKNAALALNNNDESKEALVNVVDKKKNKKNNLKKKSSVSNKTFDDKDEEMETDNESDVAVEELDNDDNEKDINKMLPGSSVGLAVSQNPKFSSLAGSVSEKTLKALEENGYEHMTNIQEKAIPPLLEGRDIVGSAKTGSGKTLAFLIPAVELIYKTKFMPRNGTGCIVISPTRELAMQTFGVLKELMKHHHHTYGLLMGGTCLQAEKNKLEKGVNIIITTPGRLLDHIQHTKDFLYKNLQCLVIDEADRLLDIGFEEELKKIISNLPKRRQTMLFSATHTEKTKALTSFALKKEPIYISVNDKDKKATVDGLTQGYIACPSDKRLGVLYTFIKKNYNKKVMVFFSSCMSVKFHQELFNYIDMEVMSIHGKQKQTKRTTTYHQFCNATTGVLFCTDVAARGLDFPFVDWIIQYDPPDNCKDYIHRVGRTARADACGHALLFLRLEELGFVRQLSLEKIPLTEMEVDWKKIPNVQTQVEALIGKVKHLHASATEAFKSFVRAYDSYQLKHIFDIEKLDLKDVGKSFGFVVAPNINLRMGPTKSSRNASRGGYGFSKNSNDKSFRRGGQSFRGRNGGSRQFSR